MCRPGVLSALLIVLVSGSVAAQGSARAELPEILRLQARADSLARLWDEANALARLADSLAHGSVPRRLDTLRVGSLVIAANQSPLPLREAAERAWPMFDSLYGSRAGELASRPLRIQAIDPDSQASQIWRWGVLVGWDKTEKEMLDLLTIYLPMPPADKGFQDWFGGELRPSTRERRVALEQSYVALVTAHYQVGQDCFTGTIGSCRTLLALEQAVNPLEAFRTAAERREVVRNIQPMYGESELRGKVIACLAGNDSVCSATLFSLQPIRLPVAIEGVVRKTLVTIAFELGGRESYARLMADSTLPMSERLSAAAGVPLDSLLSTWHSAILAARPKPVALPPYGPLVGLSWAVLFGLCALRSSRWRVA